MSASWRQEIEGGWRYSIPVEVAACLDCDTPAVAVHDQSTVADQTAPPLGTGSGSSTKWERYERIATLLTSPEQVLELVRAHVNLERPRSLAGTRFVAARTEMERALAELWAGLLRVQPVGIRDNFFELGGTSLLAVDLVARLAQRFGVRLPLTSLIEAPSIEQLVEVLTGSAERDSLVLIRDGGSEPPLFLVHDGDGETMLYRNLAMLLEPGRRIFGLQPLTGKNAPMVHTRISEMASYHISRIRSVQPHGPYLLGGMCAGGVIAFEIGRQLQLQGAEVALVALLDAADVDASLKTWRFAQQRMRSFSMVFRQDGMVRFDRRALSVATKALRKVKNLTAYLVGQRLKNMSDELQMRLFRPCVDRGRCLPRTLQRISVRTVYLFAEKGYRPNTCFSGRLVLFRDCGARERRALYRALRGLTARLGLACHPRRRDARCTWWPHEYASGTACTDPGEGASGSHQQSPGRRTCFCVGPGT